MCPFFFEILLDNSPRKSIIEEKGKEMNKFEDYDGEYKFWPYSSNGYLSSYMGFTCDAVIRKAGGSG